MLANLSQAHATAGISCDGLNNCDFNGNAGVHGINADADLLTNFLKKQNSSSDSSDSENDTNVQPAYTGQAGPKPVAPKPATVKEQDPVAPKPAPVHVHHTHHEHIAPEPIVSDFEQYGHSHADHHRAPVEEPIVIEDPEVNEDDLTREQLKMDTINLYNYYVKTVEGRAKMAKALRTPKGKGKFAKLTSRIMAIPKGQAMAAKLRAAIRKMHRHNMHSYYFKTVAGRAKINAAIRSKAGRAEVLKLAEIYARNNNRTKKFDFYFNTPAGNALIESAWKTKVGRAKVIAMRKAQQARIAARKATKFAKKTAGKATRFSINVANKTVARINSSIMYDYYFNTLAGKAWVEAAWKTTAGRAKVIAMRKAQQATLLAQKVAKKSAATARQVAKKTQDVNFQIMYDFYFNTQAGKAKIEAAWRTTAGRAKIIAMRAAQRASRLAMRAARKAKLIAFNAKQVAIQAAADAERLATEAARIASQNAIEAAEKANQIALEAAAEASQIAARSAQEATQIAIDSAQEVSSMAVGVASGASQIVMNPVKVNSIEANLETPIVDINAGVSGNGIEANIETPIVDINAAVSVPNFIPTPKVSIRNRNNL